MTHKIALVTGGARGIGAVIAARLSADGYGVVVADRQGGTSPTGARTVICDISDETEVGALIGDIAATEGRLDALVCNAGIMIRKPLSALSLAEWSSVIATNLTSTFLLVRAAESMLRAAHGSVVTIASTRAHMVGAGYRSLRCIERRPRGAHPRIGDQPWTRRAGELHQSGMDTDQGANPDRGGSRTAPGGPRRQAG